MSEKRNVPKLRFPEFKAPFERVTLGSLILDLDSGVSVNSESDTPAPFGKAGVLKTSCVSLGKFLPEENKLIVDEEIDRAKLSPRNGTIIISRMNTPALVGESGFVNEDFENLYLPDRLWLAVPDKTKADAKFLATSLTTPKTRAEISSIATGTSGSMKNISKPNFLGLEIYKPSLPEQQKIAEFLTAADRRIELLQAKKEKLEAYKKGVMQKIFSQQLRFKADDGSDFPDWEERKLGEVVSDFLVPMRDKPKDLTGPIPWCRIEDFDGKYLLESKSNQGVTIETVSEMRLKVFPVNTLLVSCSAYLGRCAIVKSPLVTNQTFIGLVPHEDKVNVEFLYYVMILAERRLNTLSSGTTISYLSREEFEKFEVSLPSLGEQQKIVKFLTNLDSTIDNLKQQITLTQAWKKGLLQKMFV